MQQSNIASITVQTNPIDSHCNCKSNGKVDEIPSSVQLSMHSIIVPPDHQPQVVIEVDPYQMHSLH